jgi:hypothetical protein
MRKSTFREEQITMALCQHEAGTTVAENCRHRPQASLRLAIRSAFAGRSSTTAWASSNSVSCGSSRTRTGS